MNYLVGAFALIGVATVATFLVFLVHGYRERRKHARIYRAMLAEFERRPRGKVIEIGTVVRDALGREHPWNFSIDCKGTIPAQSIGLHGELLIAGYTTAELVEMAKRRSEFES